MAFTRPLGPFATEIESQDYVRLSGTLAVLEHWSTMLPRFSDHEIFQIEPYLKFKTEELATLVIAGTRNEQTRTLDRLSVLREGRLGDIEECEDHINNIFRAQLLHLSGTFAASSASVPNAASSSSEGVRTPNLAPFSTTSQPTQNASSAFSLALCGVRCQTSFLAWVEHKNGPYHLTTMLGLYTICQRVPPNFIVKNFHSSSLETVRWDIKRATVTVKLVNDEFDWILNFEKDEDVKTFIHALTS